MKLPSLKLTSLTCLAFAINSVIDAQSAPGLSFREVFDAAADRNLLALLDRRYGRQFTAFSFVTQNPRINLYAIEAALSDAASAYEGRVGKPQSSVSGLCLALDIAIEAIQGNFHKPFAQSRPSYQFPAPAGCSLFRTN